jgi:D-aminopeptidase
VVAETWDGTLNDANGFHVRPEHVEAALAGAHDGPIAEGNVGGGTGMICHGFKGGTGTASRVLEETRGGYTVGVLVQANHGQRRRLQINGVPVGEHIPASRVPLPGVASDGSGSIIVVAATDAPLLPFQCDRLAQRAALGIGRTGGLGENGSGDLILAFATGNRTIVERGAPPPLTVPLQMLQNTHINALFEAVVEATEEAIVNALIAAETMTGFGGNRAYRLPHEEL